MNIKETKVQVTVCVHVVCGFKKNIPTGMLSIHLRLTMQKVFKFCRPVQLELISGI